MKLFYSIITFCMLSFGFSACGSSDSGNVIEPPTQGEGSTEDDENSNTDEDNPNGNGSEQDSTKNETNGKTLIVYFSRAGENYSVGQVSVGNTAVMAGYIQEFTHGDVFEIVPEVAYPNDYDEMRTVSQRETAENARPSIKNKLENLDDYDVVFVGSPVWYSAPPMIMRTFYEAYDLSCKIIIPFGTHEGSGISSCTTVLKSYFPNATYMESFGMRGQSVRNGKAEVDSWLNRLNIWNAE